MTKMHSGIRPKLTHYHTSQSFRDPLKKKPIEHIAKIGENANYQHLTLFQQCFPAFLCRIPLFETK